jgi:hypothetical protein
VSKTKAAAEGAALRKELATLREEIRLLREQGSHQHGCHCCQGWHWNTYPVTTYAAGFPLGTYYYNTMGAGTSTVAING